MKKFILFIFFFFNTNLVLSNENIVYLDVQFIIDNSDLGKFYKSEIKKKNEENKLIVDKKQLEIKEKETNFNNQKNILNDDEVNKKINEIKSLVNNYQLLRNELNNEIIDQKKKYSKKILSILNPILTSYVEKNNIDLVIEKKNVLIGIKKLDITNKILAIFNDKTNDINK